MKVMFCHDGSSRAQEALELTVEIFKSAKPEVIILTVVEEPLDATSVDEESFQKWREKRNEDLKEAAQWVANHGFDVDAILAVGDPRKMIIEAAETKNPDLLIIARRGGGGTEKMILGSVANYIVRHAPGPVAVM
jgi:nucleotide-binding universal stress UspA family protein